MCLVQVGTEDGCVVLFDAADDDLQCLRAFHKLEGELTSYLSSVPQPVKPTLSQTVSDYIITISCLLLLPSTELALVTLSSTHMNAN